MVFSLDCMALAGVGLEEAQDPDWARGLGRDEADAAARLGTLELNGFPAFMEMLAIVHPFAVARAVSEEVARELDDAERDVPDPVHVLENAVRAADAVRRVIAPRLAVELERRPDLSRGVLEPLLECLLAPGPDGSRGAGLSAAACLARTGPDVDRDVEALYFAAAFTLEPSAAVDAIEFRRTEMDGRERTSFLTALLPRLSGRRLRDSSATAIAVPVELLERLVVMAYEDVRLEEDNRRLSRGAYTPNERDAAEEARSGLLNLLASTPGRATYETLVALSRLPGFEAESRRLVAMAARRAEVDADGSPWTMGDLKRFEETGERRPVTPLELRDLLVRRLTDLQHDLFDADFPQAAALKALRLEVGVQNWVADRLRTLQRESYGVEREPSRAEEKKPDIVVRSKGSDASVPIEIKVAESWTLPELLDALCLQLCGRYLRARGGRHGILLLVHQEPRALGWQDPTSSRMLGFQEVVALLRHAAEEIATAGPDAPQPVVAVLDVSASPAARLSFREVRRRARPSTYEGRRRPVAGRAGSRRRDPEGLLELASREDNMAGRGPAGLPDGWFGRS